jgi:hypothetical protein
MLVQIKNCKKEANKAKQETKATTMNDFLPHQELSPHL